MKVGKEEIAGLMAALELYVTRDHDAEQRRWQRTVATVCDALRDVPGADARPAFPLPNGRPIPWACVSLRPNITGVSAVETCRRLREGRPPIYLAEWLLDQNIVGVYPCHLEPAALAVLIDRLRSTLMGRG